ncbi:MAG: protein kinase, partial [Limnobacter sp.]|nr:protein kinase [Limnobacter sp.]
MNEDKANVDSLDQTVILGANPRGSADVKPGLVATLPDGYEFSGHRIDGLIGIGGFGVVYKATDLALGRVVALKEYFPHAMAQRGPSHRVTMQQSRDQATFQAGMSSFINEARLLAKFDHTSLVKVFQFWEAHQTAYMSMPYIPGFTLKASFEQFGHPVNEQSLTTILCELARALSEMHQHRCYHRDISPDNIIMHAETGLPVLLDFGAARQAIQNQTHSFTVILKSGYAPVEQ